MSALHALFVDFNSYFASVEQQFRPELRGRPIAVVPVMAESTCCIAVSYEAKKFGIKTGTRVSLARRMCPELRVIEARPVLYVETHQKLIAAIDSCIQVEDKNVLSIDEMLCELTGKWRQQEHAEKLAGDIKKTVARKVGPFLRSSIGIAPNLLLAKAASDMQKPDGLVVIEKQALPQCLFHLELRDFSGIGPRMEKRLCAAGLHTVEALCAAPRGRLRKIWGGVEGERMFDALRGEQVTRPPTSRCMMGHSHVLAPAQRNDTDALAVLHRLLQKAAMRLRHDGYFARGLQLFVEFLHVGGFSQEIRFRETQDTFEFMNAMHQLWSRRPEQAAPPLMVGVQLLDLVAAGNLTPSLFLGSSKRRDLFACVDVLNKRYGKNTVYFGGGHAALDSAPMRIAFNRIPDLVTEGDEAICSPKIGTIDIFPSAREFPVVKYRVVIEPDEEGVFVAECPTLPGCVSQGKTRQEAITNIREAIGGYLASLEKHGETAPWPITEEIVEV